jgi:hypothetical protein
MDKEINQKNAPFRMRGSKGCEKALLLGWPGILCRSELYPGSNVVKMIVGFRVCVRARKSSSQGSKAREFFKQITARLKSCPDTK